MIQPASKARRPISAEEVARVFDDACIEKLAGIGKLPAGADRKRFAEGIREAARMYATDARTPNVNALHDEIAELHRAADRRLYEQVACLMERLSPRAHDMLSERGSRLGGIELPSPDALRDNERREAACAAIAQVCRIGGRLVEGRRRPSGKRSRLVWQPVLYAPKKEKNFDRREAERNFAMWVRLAWVEATNAIPARTARHGDRSRDPGPFARMLQKCLHLVGALDADVVELINKLHRLRRWMERRPRLE